jgi:hypothetical protein
MKKALLIGINYNNLDESIQLKGCINDSYKIKHLLIHQYSFEEKDITLMNDEVDNEKYLPTRKNIIRELHNIKNESQDTEVWLYYSGHGSFVKDMNGDEESAYDSVIMPLDYKKRGYILDDQLYRIINEYICKTIIVFDSCHSGTICDLPWKYECITNNNFDIKQISTIKMNNKNISLLSSSLDTETSIELYLKKYNIGIGVFTNAFLFTLANNGFNGPITKIYNDTCIYLRDNRFKQTPIMSSSTRMPSFKFISK